MFECSIAMVEHVDRRHLRGLSHWPAELMAHTRSNHGEPELAELFMANRPAILRYLQSHGAADAAEDLLQDLWVRTATAAAPEQVSLGYIMRMAHNLMIDRARGARQRRARELAYHEDAPQASGEIDAAPNAEHVLLARERLHSVEQALRSLGSRTEQVLRRHRIDEVPQRVVAQELGLSLSAVEKHLQKAYRALVLVQLGQQLPTSSNGVQSDD